MKIADTLKHYKSLNRTLNPCETILLYSDASDRKEFHDFIIPFFDFNFLITDVSSIYTVKDKLLDLIPYFSILHYYNELLLITISAHGDTSRIFFSKNIARFELQRILTEIFSDFKLVIIWQVCSGDSHPAGDELLTYTPRENMEDYLFDCMCTIKGPGTLLSYLEKVKVITIASSRPGEVTYRSTTVFGSLTTLFLFTKALYHNHSISCVLHNLRNNAGLLPGLDNRGLTVQLSD